MATVNAWNFHEALGLVRMVLKCGFPEGSHIQPSIIGESEAENGSAAGTTAPSHRTTGNPVSEV